MLELTSDEVAFLKGLRNEWIKDEFSALPDLMNKILDNSVLCHPVSTPTSASVHYDKYVANSEGC